MPRTGLTTEEIRDKAIDAALARMREHGFEKVRLSDVARALDISHAALYAHFANKAALLDAVTERWLNETDARLQALCLIDDEPLRKIRAWFVMSYRLKRARVSQDPELYRAFDVAAALKKPYVAAHLATANRQLVELVEEAAAALGGASPQEHATILFEAMTAFHHPTLMSEHAGEDREPLLERVLDAVLIGMSVRG